MVLSIEAGCSTIRRRMPSAEEMLDTLEADGVDTTTLERTLNQSPSDTIVPSDMLDSASRRAIGALSDLARTGGGDPLELQGTLGEGGMGIVRLAVQRSLGRQVAVKTLKEEHKTEHSTLKLLREAWVTGTLEHPNVVPIYDIALEADGTPIIVLKKIEGDAWESLIHAPAAVERRFGEQDLLEWNLRTLMQVCNAVRFAHSRGVLHRDLKPENVMIGAFGEVYLVDWGIAVSLKDDGTGRLPLAHEATELAGTPAYMAPEMLGGKKVRLSERTDVYLLGAILYEVVAGRAPHRGECLMEIVADIVDSNPPLPEDTPGELARIIRRAMDPDPDARFENAEQLRLSVQSFLHHRDAARLADRAGERLDELLEILREHEGSADAIEAREPIYHLFGECRFGFRHALEVWPGNQDARERLDQAVAAMVDYELGQGEPEAARALLGELERVPEGLPERVEAMRRSRSAEDARLRALGDQLDPSAGRRTRGFLASVIGSFWTLTPIVSHFGMQALDMRPTPGWNLAASAALALVFASVAFWARESMMRTAINRRVAFAGAAGVLSQIAISVVGAVYGGDIFVAMHELFLAWALLTGMLAAAIDWRLLIAAGGYLLCYALTPLFGIENTLLVMAAGNFVLMVNAATIWVRPTEDLAAARERRAMRREQLRRWLEERDGPRP